MVRLARSVGVSCGQYGAVNICCTPISYRYFCKIRLANWLPLSVISSFCVPSLTRIRSRNAFTTLSTVALRSGTNSIHFENRSKNINSMLFPCLVLGNGPCSPWFLGYSYQHLPSGRNLARLIPLTGLTAVDEVCNVPDHCGPVAPATNAIYGLPDP